MTTSLTDGLLIIALVSAMSVVVCPLLLWVLPDRLHRTKTEQTA